MKAFLKILLLIAAIFPIWLTIIAMGAPRQPSESWRSALNKKLIDQSTPTRKVQILEMQMTSDDFNDAYLNDSFEIDLRTENARGVSTVEVRFNDDQGRLVRLWHVPVKLSIQERTTLASRDLPRGTQIQQSDLKEEWIDASQLTDRPLDRAQAAGRTLRTAIRSGQPIFASQVDKDNLVQMGDRVRIIVTGKGLSVTGSGIAKESGQRGQTIRVLNPDSKREIYGVITDEKRVEVRL